MTTRFHIVSVLRRCWCTVFFCTESWESSISERTSIRNRNPKIPKTATKRRTRVIENVQLDQNENRTKWTNPIRQLICQILWLYRDKKSHPIWRFGRFEGGQRWIVRFRVVKRFQSEITAWVWDYAHLKNEIFLRSGIWHQINRCGTYSILPAEGRLSETAPGWDFEHVKFFFFLLRQSEAKRHRILGSQNVPTTFSAWFYCLSSP